MDWKRLLSYVTGSVDEELLLRNEYLAAENRILRSRLKGAPAAQRRRPKDPRRDRKEARPKSARRSGDDRPARDDSRLASPLCSASRPLRRFYADDRHPTHGVSRRPFFHFESAPESDPIAGLVDKVSETMIVAPTRFSNVHAPMIHVAARGPKRFVVCEVLWPKRRLLQTPTPL